MLAIIIITLCQAITFALSLSQFPLEVVFEGPSWDFSPYIFSFSLKFHLLYWQRLFHTGLSNSGELKDAMNMGPWMALPWEISHLFMDLFWYEVPQKAASDLSI